MTDYGEKRVNGSKDLYDKVCCWMADYDEFEPLSQGFGEGDEFLLLEKAMNIFYDVHKSCGGVE
tara:strand:+ start:1707 stop:1898 length:192 start_codon:yes stop_codon:yes gene_type:complete